MNNTFKTRSQIADELGISRKTLHRWLKEDNITFSRRLLSPKDQDLIYRLYVHSSRLKNKLSEISKKNDSNASSQDV